MQYVFQLLYSGSSRFVMLYWTQMKYFNQKQNFNTCHTVLHVLVQRIIIRWSTGWKYYRSAVFDWNIFLFLMWVDVWPSEADRGKPTYLARKLSDCHCATLPTVTMPLYRLSLCHFTFCHYATLLTVTMPLYRLSLCHFTDWQCATLPTVTMSLYLLSLCHFTFVIMPLFRLSLCYFTDCHCATSPTVTVPLHRLSLCHFTDCHCATLPTDTVPLYEL